MQFWKHCHMLCSPKLKIVLSTLLILGLLRAGLYAIVIFWSVADAEKRSDLIHRLRRLHGLKI